MKPKMTKTQTATPSQTDKPRLITSSNLLILVGFSVGMALMMVPGTLWAQSLNLDIGKGGGLSSRVIQLLGLMTVLSLAPSIIIMTTSFVRIVVVLSLLRTAIGLQQTPPNAVIISLSLFLTAIVMAPTYQAAYDAGVRPFMDNEIEMPQAFDQASDPVKKFMLGQLAKGGQADLALFVKLGKVEKVADKMDLPLTVITPAYMIAELKKAFEIGFILFIPFLVIDLVVASVLMSMGMMMLPPVVVSLPFKLIFWALVDGWHLVAGSLVEGVMNGTGGG